MQQRKIWIDWMKALGMLAIVWGHCFPKGGVDSFLYAFNVPVFFWVSGYLCHREESMQVCWKKCWRNLVVPYLILALLKCLGPILKHLTDGQFVYSLIGIAGGFHTFNGMTGCNNLWFVYSLILIKLLYQWASADKRRLCFLTIVAVVFAIIYNVAQLEWTWAVTNTLLAWPFFLLGNVCSGNNSTHFNQLTQWLQQQSRIMLIALAVLLAAATYFVGLHNGCAYLYQNRYGANLLLFIVGTFTGCGMMLVVAQLLDKIDWRGTRIISIGSIVILVFHRELLHPLLKIVGKQDFSLLVENLAIFIIAVGVTLAFIPITLMLKKYFPIVLGTRAKSL